MKDHDFEKIFNMYGQPIYRLALARTASKEQADDIVQQTFLLLYEKKPRFTDVSALRVWLIRTALNIIANERRRADNVRTVSLAEGYEIPSNDSVEIEFLDVVSTLPERLRDATVLYYINDISIKEIAKALGITVSAVKSRIFNARKILEKIYKEELL